MNYNQYFFKLAQTLHLLESLTDLYPNNYFPYVGDVYGATPENITPGKGFKEYVIQS